jgi:hypothetical protein
MPAAVTPQPIPLPPPPSVEPVADEPVRTFSDLPTVKRGPKRKVGSRNHTIAVHMPHDLVERLEALKAANPNANIGAWLRNLMVADLKRRGF